jgi:phosphatidylinositol alpha-mannosyltransferase
MSKIRVLQLVNGEHYAGAERVQEMLLRYLDPHLFEPSCVALINGAFVRKAQALGLPVTLLPMKHRADVKVIRELAHFLRANHIDLVHTHGVRTNVVGRAAARLAGIPVVTHVHSHPRFDTDRSWKNLFNEALDRATRRWTARFLCVSQYLYERFRHEGVPAERLRVVPNGIELEYFQWGPQLTIAAEKLRSTLGLSSETKLISMVALFRPTKGVEIFLAALAQLRNIFTNVHGLLVGPFAPPSYQHRVEAYRRHLGLEPYVHLVDFQEDVRPALAASDLIVLPSISCEGMPLSLLEAMALGRPVIASQVGGIAEIVHHGHTGLLVPPGDVHALAQAMQILLSNPQQMSAMGGNAQRFVQEHHDAKRCVRQVEKNYIEVLALRFSCH